MKTKSMIVLLLAVFMSTATAFAKELKTIVFNVPQMECVKCEKKVKDNIPFEKGVKKLTTDVAKRTVTVTYDADKTDAKKLIEGFKKFNYDATCVDAASCSEKKDSCCPKKE